MKVRLEEEEGKFCGMCTISQQLPGAVTLQHRPQRVAISPHFVPSGPDFLHPSSRPARTKATPPADLIYVVQEEAQILLIFKLLFSSTGGQHVQPGLETSGLDNLLRGSHLERCFGPLDSQLHPSTSAGLWNSADCL